MTVSAHDVAAAIRQRDPAVGKKKLHKLLYFSQGHHLATFGKPLFRETICAYDMGPVIPAVLAESRGPIRPQAAHLGEAELNTVGYVLHRYGAMTGGDLERLSHAEDPWRLADARRPPGQSVTIENAWIHEWFTGPGAPEVVEDDIALDAAQIADMLAAAHDRLGDDLRPDTFESIQARINAERS